MFLIIYSDIMWPNSGQQPPSQGALSVVTTVWGVTQTTQSGPFSQNPNAAPGFTNTNTTMSGTPYTNQQQQQVFQGNPQMQKPGQYGNPQAMVYNRGQANAVYNTRTK